MSFPPPGPTFDVTRGYQIGSTIHSNANATTYVCVNNAPGVARWVVLSGGTGEAVAGEPLVLAPVSKDAATLGSLTVDTLTAASLTVTGGITRAGRTLIVPAWFGKAGATAGWVVTGADDGLARLPASQTSSTLVVPITGLAVGDIVDGVGVVGQVESAGGNVTCVLSVHKQTSAAADIVDVELATDNIGTVTADTLLSAANLGVTGLAETMAANESLYALITGTTAGSTDIAVMGLVISLTQE